MNWDIYFMSLAFFVAMKSKDESTHHGSVIVGEDNQILSTGYNSFCRGGFDFLSDRQQRPEKYFWFEHGERNAIYNAGRLGVPLKNSRLYVTGIPCMDCARGIVQVGIKEVIMCSLFINLDGDKWKEQHKRTIELFHECKVSYRFHNEIERKIKILISGKEV